MNSQQNDTESVIKEDLGNLRNGIRIFHENKGQNSKEIAKNILKYSPASIILRVQAQKKFGKTAILLELEKQLLKISNSIIPKLTLKLKSYLTSNGSEFSGSLPLPDEYIKYFTSTLFSFCSQTGHDQNTILYLLFDEEYFVSEFLGFIKLLTENLPRNLFIYVHISAKKLHNTTLNFKLVANYYWENPTNLGSDLYFLSENHPSSLIEHLTNSEISILLRLWCLNDVAIPIGEKALQFISKYSHQEISFLVDNEELKFVINNTDSFEAEYKLCRELTFHYTYVDNLERANHYQNKALSIIDKSSISDTLKIKYRGLIWGDYAQYAQRRFDLPNAEKALITQKSIYESNENYFTNELSAVGYNLGVCYRTSGDYTRALVELSKSLELGRKMHNLDAEIETLLEMGRTYIDLGEYEIALTHLKKVENVLPEKLNTRMLYLKGIVLAYKVYLHKELGVSENLLIIAKQAINIFSTLGADEDIKKLQGIL